MYLLVVLDEVHLLALAAVALLVVGRTVVEVTARRVPVGEAVEVVGVAFQGQYLMPLHVIEDEVGVGVLHLNLLRVEGVEGLSRPVRTIDDEGQRGVPGGIDAGTDAAGVLHVNLLHLSVVADDRAALVLTHVELHTLRVVCLVVVAVDALPVLLVGVDHVAIEEGLVEVLQAALVEGEVLVRHITG